MPQATRRSARKRLSPSTASGTGTTDVSPIFSTPASVKEIDSPPTSDIDQEPTKKPATRARLTTTKKRGLPSDIDASEPEDTPTKRPSAKRRAVTNRAYVEISKRPDKAGVILPCSKLQSRNLEQFKTTTLPIKKKGKGKAPVRRSS